MKTIKTVFSIVLVLVAFNSCVDEYTEIYTANSPVYMTYENLREAVKTTSARDLVNPGKIYFKDGYIFVNEMLKGIHIIDNRQPQNPQKIGFIEIPGNADIAIKNNTLYADSYIDLVAIDISNVTAPKEVSRVQKVFPYTTPPVEDEEYPMAKVEEDEGVVIDWEIKQVRQKMEYQYYPVYTFAKEGFRNSADMAANSGAAQTSFGVGGSMARFGLHKDYLYAVDNSRLYMFDVFADSNPKSIGAQNVGWSIETMFIYDGHMFFGTQNGMIIFNLEVPTAPKYVGQFWHTTACDPVVVADGYAYITLRGGNRCGSNINRLDVLQLSPNYVNNKMIASYPMNGPYGLGIDKQTLFVCDGDAGLKVFNATDKLKIDKNLIAQFSNINTYDVIPVGGYLFMIGKDGFYQYDYKDLKNIRQISVIPVVKPK
jgi:hypothetical protein